MTNKLGLGLSFLIDEKLIRGMSYYILVQKI